MFSTLFKRTGRVALAAAAAFAVLSSADTTALAAQQGTVTGQVVDANSLQPVVGAQVFLPDLDLGSLTDEDGRYRIAGVPAGSHELRVRLLGYRPASRQIQVQAGETVTTNFQLTVSAVSLEEVVVTATGEQRRRAVGTAHSIVEAAQEVERAQPQNVTDLLKGRAAGVSIQRNAGSVGTASNIKIRGVTSISLDNTPLLYIDGARVDNNDSGSGLGVGGQDASRFNDINPEDIESIEVIKGPAAAALYGTSAAAGVILIQTKQGSGGDTRYTFRTELGVNREDLTDWPSSAWNPSRVIGFPTDTLYLMNLLEESKTPFPEVSDLATSPFRDGAVQTYAATVRGGVAGVNYYASGEANIEDGNLQNNEFERFNVRANMNLSPSDRIDLSVSNGYTANSLDLPDNDNNGFGFIGVAMIGSPWNMPIERQDLLTGESVVTCPLSFEIHRLDPAAAPLGALGCNSPFFGGRSFEDIKTLVNRQEIERYTGSGTLNWRPVSFLSGRFTLGYDSQSSDVFQLVPVSPDGSQGPFGQLSLGNVDREEVLETNVTLDGSITGSVDLPRNLNSQTTFGGQFFKEETKFVGAEGQTLPAGCETVSCSLITTGQENFVEEQEGGFFFQERVGWRDRLFGTVAVRFDDNSATGSGLGIEDFWSANGSYVLSDETWFPGFFDSFRLRGGWGQSGLQPGPFDALRLLDPTRVTFQNANVVGVSVTDPGNSELDVETVSEKEVGFDLAVLDGRLSLEFTWYDQTTTNSITFQQLKPSFGFPGNQPTNVGEMTSEGFEIGMDAVAFDRENLRWDWRFTFATNDGQIEQLDQDIIFGLGGASQRHREGFEFGSYFTERVFFDETLGQAVADDTISFHGHPTPEFEGSLSTTVTLFNRVTLYGLLDMAGGHQTFNATEEFRCGFALFCPNVHETDTNGNLTEEAQVKFLAQQLGSESPWIEDADYAKLRTVSIRFDLPESWVSLFSARGASFTLIGENLATFTGYSGLDPEINGAGAANASRFEFLTLPLNQRFLAQMQLTF